MLMTLSEIKNGIAEAIDQLQQVREMLERPTEQNLRVAARITGTVCTNAGYLSQGMTSNAERLKNERMIREAREPLQYGEQDWIHDHNPFGLDGPER